MSPKNSEQKMLDVKPHRDGKTLLRKRLIVGVNSQSLKDKRTKWELQWTEKKNL